MDEREFLDWCRHLDLSAQAKAVVERIRTSQPARSVQSGVGNVSGAYPSRKMGVTIQFESHKNELAAIHLMEHNPDVLEYYDQPESIKLSYLTKEGRPTGCLHTPDFFVLRRQSAGWEECKLEEALPKLSKEKPNRYVRTPEGKWDCPPGRQHAELLGLYYRIVSSAEIDWALQRNLGFLEDYHRGIRVPIQADIVTAVCAAVAAEPGITLASLLRVTQQEASRDNVFALIAEETLYVDLSVASLAGDPSEVRIFKDRATAQAISVITSAASPSRAGSPVLPASIYVRVGTSFLWDGRAVKILNIGQKRLSLLAEDEQIVEVKQTHWEELLRSGKITAVQPLEDTVLAEARNKAAKLIAAAAPDELATANFRYSVLAPYLQENTPISEPVPMGLPPVRSLRRWRSSYLMAESQYGCGFLGLLPSRSEQGNRSEKLPESTVTLMAQFVQERYETITKETATAVHRALILACEKQGIICPSLKTFKRAIKARPEYEQLFNREGGRKAYSRQPFYLESEPTTSRHGDRPFEIGHIDHTELDLESVCSRTGRNLGRPWLTLLVDAFSRRILAIYITFDPPSYRSCMMVLRICVLRHGRMPQNLVTDGGKEFASIYFQALLAAYECTRKQRPAAKARFGSVCERLFGTTNKQFVHLLTGNTQLTRNVRQLTKSINPKAHALWTLPTLYNRLMEYAYEIYDGNAHPALGQTPGEAFARGLELGGERRHRRIAYDEGFKMLTLPTTARGKAKVQPGSGVKINYLYYWANELGNPEVEKSLLPVRYDPFDLSTAYVFVAGHWIKCVSSHWQVFRGRSEREMMLASTILHRQNQNHANRELLVTAKRLAEFMAKVKNEEEMLLQRDQDAETKAVFTLVEGGKSNPSPTAFTLYEDSVPTGAKVIQTSVEPTDSPQDSTPKSPKKVSPWAAAANPANLVNFRGA